MKNTLGMAFPFFVPNDEWLQLWRIAGGRYVEGAQLCLWQEGPEDDF